ncbi:type I pantothenate kinase [Buchananella hordeovulneris]|uniref:Pantothenate kinase n=1 Tax=Buchananella hordeovulneris TaxID=52770 RepID=A0A1Q5PZ26_9ACTO|nr:type I pantothenate kinase [Buchananella hordeovulneris]MDO5080212.1 type I pantothenate kinase [Buchananella hordeovulneris]OKL52881.1 type I pantothenate kinase [Buchananella hordeovulneris]
MSVSAESRNYTPFTEFTREQWSALAAATPLPLTQADVQRLTSLGDPIGLAEVDAIYRPLSALLQLHIAANKELTTQSLRFLRAHTSPTPFVIAVAGSVAVGKSTVSRLLREMLRRWPRTPRVDLVTTDGFLLPNAELERRGLMDRKGFPESYDRRALLRFLTEVKSGVEQLQVPVYSHVTYDIVPAQYQTVCAPDVLIVEGLNVLQPARATARGTFNVAVSDFFDFSIYVDARPGDIASWYVERFLKLRDTAFSRPDSYFHTYASLSDTEAVAHARRIWQQINLPNLVQNIAPTRGRAGLIMQKDASHRVQRLLLRKR